MSGRIRSLLYFAATLSCLTLMASTANSQVQITNASFEDPPQALNDNSLSIPGWSGTGTFGVWRPATGYFDVAPPDGLQVGWIDDGAIEQQLTTMLEANMQYSLQVDVGKRTDAKTGDVSIELRAGNALLASTTLLQSTDQMTGQFVTANVNYTAASNDPSLGSQLSIRIAKVGGNQTDFDNVRLNVVPAPSALLTLLVGAVPGAGLLLRRRRK